MLTEQYKQPRCQPTPSAKHIHHGLPPFFLSSPSRIYEHKTSTFHCSNSNEAQHRHTHPHFAAVCAIPWRNTPLLSPWFTAAELLVSPDTEKGPD